MMLHFLQLGIISFRGHQGHRGKDVQPHVRYQIINWSENCDQKANFWSPHLGCFQYEPNLIVLLRQKEIPLKRWLTSVLSMTSLECFDLLWRDSITGSLSLSGLPNSLSVCSFLIWFLNCDELWGLSSLSFAKSLGLENPYAEFYSPLRCLLIPYGVVLQSSCALQVSFFFFLCIP
jgi:hypothetical protein